MKKRVLSMLLALAMALGLGVPAFAADEFEAEEPAVQEEAAPEAPLAEEPEEEAPAEPIAAAAEPAEDEPAPAATVIASGNCGDQGGNVTWTMTSDGTLTISGTGRMKDYYDSYIEPVPWEKYRPSKVVIGSGVTSIGAWAFDVDADPYITSVTIPDTVTSIGEYAFGYQYNLKNIDIPSSVKYFGVEAFGGTGWLNDRLSRSQTVIVNNILLRCEWEATSVTIPNTVTSIAAGAFLGCDDIIRVKIPSSVTSISDSAFAQSGLIAIDIPSSVETIGACAFARCFDLKTVTIRNPRCEIQTIVPGFPDQGEVSIVPWLPVVIRGYDGSTAEAHAKQFDLEFESLGAAPGGSASGPDLDSIQPPAGGTGWRYVEETGDYYYFKNGRRVGDYWIGKAEGGSKWADLWYYADADGKLLTGFQYLDDLKGGKAWYMLQVNNDNGTMGKMLTGWQWTYTDAGEGWFNTGYGSQGMCTWTQGWGSYNAATGFWGDGQSHKGVISAGQPGKEELAPVYRAYMDRLIEKSGDIEDYYWHSDKVAFADVTGDGIPELLYMTEQPSGYQSAECGVLNIETFKNGRLVSLCSADGWDARAGAGTKFYFFKQAGKSELYAFHMSGEMDDLYEFYYCFTKRSDGTLEQKEICTHAQTYSYGRYTDTCTVGGRSASMDEYSKLVWEMENSTSVVLMYNTVFDFSRPFAGDFVEKYGCPAMTYDEAIAYLNQQIG